MSAHEPADLIRRRANDNPSCSVVTSHHVSHYFVTAVPRNDGALRDQVTDVFRGIKTVMEEERGPGEIVTQTVFLRDAQDLPACRELLRKAHGDQMPATTYILQPPCCGKLVAIEVMGLGHSSQQIMIERVSEQMVIVRDGDITWFHCANVVPQTSGTDVYQRSVDAFEQMEDMLGSRGLGFGNVIRTWLYLGDIVGNQGGVQRYTELNRARTDYFREIHFGAEWTVPEYRGPVYPASTGIGTWDHDLMISGVAIDGPSDQIQLLPLENPRQTSACDYARDYSPQSPKFARAMAVITGQQAMILLSGTASITRSESRFPGDAELQTQQTLDNMEALISKKNFAHYGRPELGATLDDLAYARVYVKHQQDYQKIRMVCETRMGHIPTIYAIADVCRPELLVEIEAVAFSSA